MTTHLLRRAGAEFVGTGLLLAAVVGSGIAAQRLSPHDVGLELLENAAATAAALVASSAPAFVAFQLVGALLAVAAVRLLYPGIEAVAGRVVVPRESAR